MDEIISIDKIDRQAVMAARLHHVGQPMECAYPEGTIAHSVWVKVFDRHTEALNSAQKALA